jgi:hypothetical protein
MQLSELELFTNNAEAYGAAVIFYQALGFVILERDPHFVSLHLFSVREHVLDCTIKLTLLENLANPIIGKATVTYYVQSLEVSFQY